LKRAGLVSKEEEESPLKNRTLGGEERLLKKEIWGRSERRGVKEPGETAGERKF